MYIWVTQRAMTTHYTTNHLVHRAAGKASYTTLLRVANDRMRSVLKFAPTPTDGGSDKAPPAAR